VIVLNKGGAGCEGGGEVAVRTRVIGIGIVGGHPNRIETKEWSGGGRGEQRSGRIFLRDKSFFSQSWVLLIVLFSFKKKKGRREKRGRERGKKTEGQGGAFEKEGDTSHYRKRGVDGKNKIATRVRCILLFKEKIIGRGK